MQLDDVARRPRPRTRRWSPGPATRCERGGSRRQRGGHHATRSARSCVRAVGARRPSARADRRHDPAVTLRNSVTAALKEYLLDTAAAAAQPAAAHGAAPEPVHRSGEVRAAGSAALADARFENGERSCSRTAYHAALNYGDAAGAAYLGVSQPVVDAPAALARLTPAARRVMHVAARDARPDRRRGHRGDPRHRPAALQRPEARAAGHRRAGGGRHRPVARAERDRGARQDQRRRAHRRAAAPGARPAPDRRRRAAARRSKRARDTDAAAMNMQLVTWRDGRAANEAFVAGTGDALRTWRQP